MIVKWFGNALIKALKKEVNWTLDTIMVGLYTGTIPVEVQDEWIYKDDITGITEIAQSGNYITGGAKLATPTIEYISGTNIIKLNANDTTWTNSIISSNCAIIYVKVGTDFSTPEDDVLLGYVDFEQTFSSNTGDFTITWDAEGIFTIEIN
jgi:hypothetical protein